MNTKIKSVIAAASVLALSAISANAQLLLNHSQGTFSNIVGASTVTGSGLDLASTTIWTPSSPSEIFSVTSTNQNLGVNFGGANLGNALKVDTWSLDRFGSSTVGILTSFDFTLKLDFGPIGGPIAGGYDLAITERVTLSLSGSTLVYTLTQLSPSIGIVNVGGTLYNFEIAADGTGGSLFASTGSTNGTTNINLVFTAVPEPSTYALFGVVALMGVVAVRRFRSSKSVAA